jgi:hypothetical protein
MGAQILITATHISLKTYRSELKVSRRRNSAKRERERLEEEDSIHWL